MIIDTVRKQEYPRSSAHRFPATKGATMFQGGGSIARVLILGALVAWSSARADLLVVGHFSGNILRYDDSGAFVSTFWSGSAAPLGIAVGPDGAIYTSNLYIDHISRFDAAAHVFVPFTSGGTILNPHQIAFGGPGNDLYSTDLGGFGPRAAVNRFDGDTGAFVGAISMPTGAGASAGIAVDEAGTLYISDRPTGTLFKYESGSLSVLASMAPDIEGLTLGPDGKLYVGSGDTRVLRFSLDGTPYGVGGDTSNPIFIDDSRLDLAFSVTFDESGVLYVASSRSSEVLRYSAAGEFIDTFISAGAGGLNYPTYMVFTAPVPELPGAWMLLLGAAWIFGSKRIRRAHTTRRPTGWA